MDRAVEKMTTQNKALAQDVSKLAVATQSACAEASNASVRWAGDAKNSLALLMETHDGNVQKSMQVSIHYQVEAG